ncbi:MAG: HNH endonuclease family protein, partial [Bacteroidales bacterium]|nr:HNH endonuclease family protein [Bacteroidales bacterium]
MLKYSQYYKQAGKGETGMPLVDTKLRELASIGSNVCMPFYMEFLCYAKENGLSEHLQLEVFDIVENYWARRIICGWPANVMSKTFALLHNDIMRIYKQHQKRNVELDVDYAEIMKYILLKKQGTGEFPSDSYVDEYFPQRQVYKMPSSYRMFLFERMENRNSKERDDEIIQKMEDGSISIEHIMPQNLNAQWKKDLGPQADEIKDMYLHTFANLTLTGYNSEYSNRSYIEKWSGYTIKKKMKGEKEPKEIVVTGYKDSPFRLSSYLKDHQQWTENEMAERGKLLLAEFKRLWPMIKTQYVPLEKDVDIVSLDDDDAELTNRYISAYIYRGTRHAVSSWKEMVIEVCKLLYGEKPTEMLYLATKNDYLFSESKDSNSKVADNCYVWTNNSTRSKRQELLYLFAELSISPSELEVELVPQHDEEDDDGDDL